MRIVTNHLLPAGVTFRRAERREIHGWDIEIECGGELLHLAFVDENRAQGVVPVDKLAKRVLERRLIHFSTHVKRERFVVTARCIVT